MKKTSKIFLGCVIIALLLTLSACNFLGIPYGSNDIEISSDVIASNLPAYTAIQQEDGLTFANAINAENSFVYYYFYLGKLYNTPVFISESFCYDEDTSIAVEFPYSSELSNIGDYVSKTSYYPSDVTYSSYGTLPSDASYYFSSIKYIYENQEECSGYNAAYAWTEDWNGILENHNTYLNSYNKIYNSSDDDLFSPKIDISEENGFVKGYYYRMAYYETVNVYGVLVYDVKNKTYYSTTDSFLLNNNFTRVWETSTNSYFSYSSNQKLSFNIAKAINYVEQNNMAMFPTIFFPEMSGLGTESSPYLIYSVEQLQGINNDLSASYKLMSDLDLSNIEWLPIGLIYGQYKKFSGSFDGNGHTIKGLTMNASPLRAGVDSYVGLFGIVEDATLTNIKFKDVNILFPNKSKKSTYVYVGTLVGRANNSEISKIAVSSGKVQGGWDIDCKGDEYIGGIVGSANETTIKLCANKAEVLGYHQNIFAGGILGFCQGEDVSILCSYNTGYIEIATSKKGSAGGIVGVLNGKDSTITIKNCYVCCSIKNADGKSSEIGGIIAVAKSSDNNSTIRDNYYCVEGTDEYRGDFEDVDAVYKNDDILAVSRIDEMNLSSGNELSEFYTYSSSAFAWSDKFCWVYRYGQLPKLFFE